MVLLEVTWIFSFQACSLILADSPGSVGEFSSSSGGAQLLLQRWQVGTPVPPPSTCPEGPVFPVDAQLCPQQPHCGHPAPGEPQNLCRTWGVLSGGGPGLTHPGIEGRDQGCQRDGGQGLLFLSSSSASGEAIPSVTVPPGAPSPSLPAAYGTSALQSLG